MDKNNVKVNFRIVLFEPEIPANTGNIGRLCVGSNSELHIIKPMRFFINDKYVKRAGLDYWSKLKLHVWDSLDDFLEAYPENTVYYCTTKTEYKYSDKIFKKGDIFIFGPESRGIPENILKKKWDQTITIPMSKEIRSINLSNSVAIVLYEAWKQITFI